MNRKHTIVFDGVPLFVDLSMTTATPEQLDTVADVFRKHRRPLSRADLVAFSSLKDRLVRKCMEALGRAGLPIVKIPGGKGYFVTDDPRLMRKEANTLKRQGTKIIMRSTALATYAARRERAMSGELAL